MERDRWRGDGERNRHRQSEILRETTIPFLLHLALKLYSALVSPPDLSDATV